jgi:hypothetical protein
VEAFRVYKLRRGLWGVAEKASRGRELVQRNEPRELTPSSRPEA